MTLNSRNGKLWITFYHQSKRYRRSLDLDDTKQNRKIAEQQLIPTILHELNSGTFFKNEIDKKPTVPTLDQFTKISFEMHEHERRELTQIDYARKYANHVQAHFGKKRIDEIKSSDVARWQNRLLKTHSSKTLRNIRTVFQTIMEDAMCDEIINVNPFVRVKLPRQEDVLVKLPFNVEEIFLIIKAMPKHMQCFFAVGFFTGMRTGEIIGLKWIDIDFDEKIIQVRRSRRQGTETKPKTKSSIRDIEIIDALMPYLKEHRTFVDPNSTYVFETSRGAPFNTCAKIAEWYWKPVLKQLGLTYRNLYQMRHTFASMMISNGEDILWVSNMLGHKDSSMTLEKYARYIKQNNKKRATFLSL